MTTQVPSSKDPSLLRKRIAVVVGSLVALGLIVGLALAIASEEPADHGQQTAPVSVEGAGLPPLDPTSQGDPAVGMAAPKVTGVDFSGLPVEVGGSTGEVQVLFFAAHWCPHCQAELPLLVDYAEKNPDLGGAEVTVVLTSTSPLRPNFPPSQWIEREGWTGRTFLDSETYEAGNAFGLSSFPFFVVVGRDGRVALRVAGEIPLEPLFEFVSGL